MEVPFMVIKAKYRDKMRRFRVRIVKDELDHTIYDLNAKIASLFGLSADHLTLTYVDVDGDEVGLVDDDDLRDIVQQGFNPFRVTVVSSQKTMQKSLREMFVKFLDRYKGMWFSFRKQPREEAKGKQPDVFNTSDYITPDGVSKLESCLVGDENVLDKPIAPSTEFKKFWRMKNNGVAEWPHKTELIWIGGDRLGDRSSVELDIPETGLPVEKVVDIIADLVSPEIPGEYVAFWRLASPTGEMFGQCIKAVVEVGES